MSNRRKLILPRGRFLRGRRVRNPVTGRILPCCYADCWEDGNDDIKIVITDVQNGEITRAHYIFCSEAHKQAYIDGSRTG